MRIVIADDHSIVRAGVRMVLDGMPGVEVVAEASDGEAAMEAIERLKPDFAVLDIEMPKLSGLDIARRLAANGPATSVLMLSMHVEQSFVRSSVDAGVCAYLVKQDAAVELPEALAAAERGGLFISPRVTGSLIASLRRDPDPAVRLAPRERDVLRLLSDGLSSKEIAASLKLSTKTVEGYRAQIMGKLGIRSLAGLVKYAIRMNLASADE
jgi:DNA-binding NarL/FixJ family response regulator